MTATPEPVVAGALGERHGEHEQPDEQGAWFRPRLQRVTGACLRRGVLVRDDGQEAAHGERHGHGDDHRDGDEVRGDADVEGDQGRTEERPGDRAEAEPGVEARHDRAALTLLDLRACDVHGDVPGPVAEPHEEQADDHGRHTVRVPDRDGREADGQQDRHREDRARRAQPGDDDAGDGQGDDRADGEGQQDQAEGARRPARGRPAPGGCARPSWRTRGRCRRRPRRRPAPPGPRPDHRLGGSGRAKAKRCRLRCPCSSSAVCGTRGACPRGCGRGGVGHI